MSRRTLTAAAAIAAMALGVLVVARDGGGGVARGSALDEGAGGGVLAPLRPGESLSAGVVATQNVSGVPVRLVSARMLRLDPDVELLGFTAHPYGIPGGVPITAREWPVPGGQALREFPTLAPRAKALQVVISVGMKVRPGGEGKAVGVAVRYRQGDALKEQVFRQQIFVCSVPELVPHCPGHPDDAAVFGSFEDELRSGELRTSRP
jgi:hypothetical protein